ncbi:MAG TPA: pteridine reductase [Rhodocyclaceae bacterium]|nr:pteridine reductase [Rhodocyclaceae bacterium]
MNSPAVVMVTGGARRVGAAIVRVLHEAGCRVAIHYRGSGKAAMSLAQDLEARRPGSAFAIHADLLDTDTLPALVAAVTARFGRLDGLVNNASSFFPTPFGEISQAQWSDLIGTNLRAPLFLTQAAAPALRASNGAVVNIVDIHAERPLPGYLAYSVAKSGLLGLTRALAIELAPQVRVNGVSPGAVEWPEDGQFSVDDRSAIIEHALLKRMGSPQDIATAVRFLLLEAPYVTGQILAVDGGRSAHL